MASLVSVLIPVYNRREYVGEAITSVFEDPYKDVEVVVVDDGSTDGTREAVLSLEVPSPRTLRYIRTPNQGACSARNVAANASNGKFLLFLDSDDKILPGKIEESVREIEKSDKVVIVCTDWVMKDDQGNDSRKGVDIAALEDLFLGRPRKMHVNMQTSAPLWRASYWKEKGGAWPKDLFCWQENSTYVPLLLSAGNEGHEFRHIEKVLYIQNYSGHDRIGSHVGSERYLVGQAEALELIFTSFLKKGRINDAVTGSYLNYSRNLLRQSLLKKYPGVWTYSVRRASANTNNLTMKTLKSLPFPVVRNLFLVSCKLSLLK